MIGFTWLIHALTLGLDLVMRSLGDNCTIRPLPAMLQVVVIRQWDIARCASHVLANEMLHTLASFLARNHLISVWQVQDLVNQLKIALYFLHSIVILVIFYLRLDRF